MDADKKAALAGENFRSGYNCAQSVLLAFCEETGLKKEAAARFASSFGGGMGRMREVCGAVSGMFMVAGLLTGYDDPKDRAAKAALYERVRNLAGQFTEKNGSIICRKLLEGVPATGGGAPGERTEPITGNGRAPATLRTRRALSQKRSARRAGTADRTTRSAEGICRYLRRA